MHGQPANMPQHPFYVTDQSNPGVATMNTAPMAAQYPMQRQAVERIAVDIPYPAPGLAVSVQSSPSTFSTPGRSPSTMDRFYTHQPPQAATYALQGASPVDQQPPLVNFHDPMHQHPQPQPPHQGHPAIPAQYQQPQAQSEEQWAYQYQSPVEVTPIGPISAYGTVAYNPWEEPKLEFETAGMTMPSARIDEM